MKRVTRTYRGPVVASVALFLASVAWAWMQWSAALDRERVVRFRTAEAMAAALAPVFDLNPDIADDDEALRRLLEERVTLRRPLCYAVVLRGDQVLASFGDPRARVDADADVWVERYPVVGEPVDSSGRPPLEWRWTVQRALSPLVLEVGIDRGVPPHLWGTILPEILGGLLVAWVGILALVVAWIRAIRARALSLALDRERAERERLTELNLAAAGLAHETKNPLGIILGFAQRIADDEGASVETRASADAIVDAADRAASRIGDFLSFAGIQAAELVTVDAAAQLTRVVSILRPDFDQAGITLEVDAPGIPVRCAPPMLEQVLVNLLLNCLAACDSGATVELRLARAGPQTARISVEDDGSGIPSELVGDVFRPYVTGRPDGHGLGLAVVKRIADQHGWRLTLESEPGSGTRVTIDGIEVSGEAP